MQIEQIGLRRFKSIYDMDLSINRFSVLTGPNGSGKSNLTSALDFLGETYLYGLEYAVGRFGGLDSIAYRRTRRTTTSVHFSIVARMDRKDFLNRYGASRIARLLPGVGTVVWFGHEFSIRPSNQVGDSIFTVADEKISIAVGSGIDDKNVVVVIGTGAESGKRSVSVDVFDPPPEYERFRDYLFSRLTGEINFGQYAEQSVAPTELLLTDGYPIPVLREFRQALSRLRVFRLNPSSCRLPGVLTPNANLDRDGSNLPGVIARMRREASASVGRRKAWRELLKSMAEVFDGLKDIHTGINASGGLELKFVEAGVGRPWSANEVSDGTIQYLALLAAMLESRSPIIVVEEPENALHSWLLRLFLERCRSQTDSQVLLTTHSPVALKAVTPNEVILVWKVAGRTYADELTSVDPDSMRIYEEQGVDVFEQYDSGVMLQTLPFAEGSK